MIKVLVVDDEASIREALKDFLEAEGGYEVLLAENGAMALETFGAQEIDLVFLDVKMPGMDGIELFRRMKQIKPGIKTVIITGLPDEETFDRALAVSEEVVEGFIPKPFKPPDLRKCLRTVLAGDRHAAFQLTPAQLDSLGGLAGSIMTTVSKAASDISGSEVAVIARNVNAIPLSQISKPLEEPGLFSVGLVTRFEGSLSGILLILLPWEGALALVDMAQKRPAGTTHDFDERSQARLRSLGAVLAGAYLGELSSRLGLRADPGPPEIAFKHRNALIQSMAREMAPSWNAEGEGSFALETEAEISEPSITCWFSLIPSADSLKSILRALGTLK